MRILIIEDENKTATYLSKGLKANGYSVAIAADGQEGLFLANECEFDLIILDVMLPKLDGWAVLKQLRYSRPDVRVLFLSARDSINDKVKGFELGADDYLAKPFSFSELLGRIRALLRRNISPKVDKICIADLEIDLLRLKAKRGSRVIDLTAQEFTLLVFLAERTGEVQSRAVIAEAVWDINFYTETNVIDVAVRRLRQKVDLDATNKLIHTVRGIGYVFEEKHT